MGLTWPAPELAHGISGTSTAGARYRGLTHCLVPLALHLPRATPPPRQITWFVANLGKATVHSLAELRYSVLPTVQYRQEEVTGAAYYRA